jgi:hypothetical protein
MPRRLPACRARPLLPTLSSRTSAMFSQAGQRWKSSCPQCKQCLAKCWRFTRAFCARVLRGGFARGVQNVRGARDLRGFASACFRADAASPCASCGSILCVALGDPILRAKFEVLRGACRWLAPNSRLLCRSTRAQLGEFSHKAARKARRAEGQTGARRSPLADS